MSRKVLLGVLVIFAMLCGNSVALPPAAATTGGYPYADYQGPGSDPAQSYWTDKNGNPYSPYRYVYRNCTDFVAWKLATVNGWNPNRSIGNAANWGKWATANGYVVNHTPKVGAVAWWNNSQWGHVAYVTGLVKNAAGTITRVVIEQYNRDWDGKWSAQEVAVASPAGYIHFKDLPVEPPASPPGGLPSQQTVVLDYADSVWAKNGGLEYGGWTQETANGSAKAIAAGGGTHLLLDFCDAIWAREGVGSGGWVQETACHSAKAIAVSETGLQMLLDFCGAVWAKRGIGYGGWVQQTGCDGHKAIAVAGDTQVILNACNAVWAKQGIGWGGWNEETACDSAVTIAVGSTGIQALIDWCGSVWAKRGIGYGGWMRETGCDGHKAIAIGGEQKIVINACDAVWAKTGIGWGGWAEETTCGSAKAIAMGSLDRQTILGFDGSIWAKQGIDWGGWAQQAGPWSAKMVEVG